MGIMREVIMTTARIGKGEGRNEILHLLFNVQE